MSQCKSGVVILSGLWWDKALHFELAKRWEDGPFMGVFVKLNDL